MDPTLFMMAAFGLFFAGVIKGASGLGYSSCALPFLAAAIDVKTAIVLVVIPAMVSNLALIWTAGHCREMLGRFWPFYLATLPGIVLGIHGLSTFDARTTEIVLGLLISGYALYSIVRPPVAMPVQYQGPVQMPAGLLNGFLTGLTGSQVLPLLPYMLSLQLDPARMVQAVNLSVTLASAFMAVGLLTAGLMTLPTLGFSVLAILPAIAGIYLGSLVRGQIPSAHFKTLVLVVLGCIGLALMLRP